MGVVSLEIGCLLYLLLHIPLIILYTRTTMKREVGFYFVVPGLSTYLTLVLVLYYFPVAQAKAGTLSSEDIVFYGFLTVVCYLVGLILTIIGNKGLALFSLKWAIPFSLVPLVMAFAYMIVM